MFLSFVRVETRVSLAATSCRAALVRADGTVTSGSQPKRRKRARAAASAWSVFFFERAMTWKRYVSTTATRATCGLT